MVSQKIAFISKTQITNGRDANLFTGNKNGRKIIGKNDVNNRFLVFDTSFKVTTAVMLECDQYESSAFFSSINTK